MLDNFEHVLAAAGDVPHLLAACPGLTILVTSRAPLQLSGEQRFATLPLSLPAPGEQPAVDALTEFSAVALFVDRARWVRRGFALDEDNAADVVAICRRLDGLSLAIELAVAWVHILPPAALLTRLERRLPLLRGGAEDQPVRLRTMRDAIAWSYDLLSADEARLLRRLAVFVGGFTLEAAERVGTPITHHPSPSSTPPSVLNLIASLVEKSLLQPEPANARDPRFTMLETVREFALERLAVCGEEPAAREAHAASVLEFAERAEPHLLGPEERRWQARCDAELGNLRAALTWALEHDVATALRIGAALWAYWSLYQIPEGRRWLTVALSRSPYTNGMVQARALTTHSALAARAGDAVASAASADAAVILAQETGDVMCLAHAHWVAIMQRYVMMGTFDANATELDLTLSLFEQATTSTDRIWAAYARSQCGTAALMQGEKERGVVLFEEALARARAAGSDGIALVILSDFAGWLINLGETPPSGGGGLGGETSRARGYLEEALALAADHRGGNWMVLSTLISLALIDALEGAAVTAARRLGAIDAKRIAWGQNAPAHYQARMNRAQALAEDSLGKDAYATIWAAGRADPDTAIAGALDRPSAVPIASHGTDRTDPDRLTPREREVLRLVVEGQSDKEIAAALGVSRRTASNHVAAIRAKLDAPSRSAMAAIAVRDGLI